MNIGIPAAAKHLLDFIIETETGKSGSAAYDTIFGNRESKWPTRLTEMTINQVLAAQKTWSSKAWAKRFGSEKASSAAGGPQFMRTTLTGLKQDLGLTGDERMTPALQDFLGYALLKRRGYRAFIAGTMTRTAFGKALAQEWASFPVLAATTGGSRKVKRGQSFYAGDGLNKSLVSPETVERLLDDVLEAVRSTDKPETAPTPAGPDKDAPDAVPESKITPSKPKVEKLSISKRFWTWLVTGIVTPALPFVDWRAQMLIAGVVGTIAIYAIVTMPRARQLLGLA